MRIQLSKKDGQNNEACPKDPRGVDGDEIPRDLRLMGGDKLPRGFLCQRLRGLVYRIRICRTLRLHRLDGGIIPVGFVENARQRNQFENRDNRRGEDHTLHVASMFQGRIQDRCGSTHGRDDEICICLA